MGSRLAFFTCLHRLSVRLSSPLGKIMYVEFPHTAWSDLSGLKSLSALRSSCCFDGCRNFFLSSSAVCISKSSLFAFSIFALAQFFFSLSGDHHCCQDEYVPLLLGRMSLRLKNIYAWRLVDRENLFLSFFQRSKLDWKLMFSSI